MILYKNTITELNGIISNKIYFIFSGRLEIRIKEYEKLVS